MQAPSFNFNLKLGRRGGADIVGLDIQPGHVAAVQARVNGSIVVKQRGRRVAAGRHRARGRGARRGRALRDSARAVQATAA